MILKFSDNIFRQVIGITFYNLRAIVLFLLFSIVAVLQHSYSELHEWMGLDLPVVPVTILGGALAIFLGFRNNSAYDRWWEARKIWGGIVNKSRTLASFALTFPSAKHGDATIAEVHEWQKVIIQRHISWLYALKFHLRRQSRFEKLEEHLPKEEYENLMKKANKPAQLLHLQNQAIAYAFEAGMIDNFRHLEMARLIKDFYDLQGMNERIKNTVFPFYYNYFTQVFLWLFILCLPFTLVPIMGIGTIPMAFGISFIFYILDKSGELTEDPFEGRAADTPMSTIVRSIEIDLLEMLGEKTPPKPLEVQRTQFDVMFME